MTDASDFGAASVKPLHREVRRAGGVRTVAVRSDGVVVYIEETLRAGMLRLRVPALVERWRDQGVIGDAELQAADRFVADYRLIHLPVRYASAALERIDRGTVVVAENVELAEARGRAEARTLRVLASIGEMVASILAEFLVNELSLRDLAKMWRTTVDDMRGRLVAGLAVLAAHYSR